MNVPPTVDTVSVIGTGYLGIVQAAVLAEQGLRVLALDRDPERVDTLARGILPIAEPGLEEVFTIARESGRLTFTTDHADLAPAQVHLLCVGTPQSADGHATDTSSVFGAALALAPHLRPEAIVVGRSTVPVGTAAAVQAALSAAAGRDVAVVWSPEFVRQGCAVADTQRPSRLVYGVGRACPTTLAMVDEVFAPQLAAGTPRIVVDHATAELAKQAANAFLATKVSFVNAVAEVCERSGADVKALSAALGLDPRIGHQFLSAGLGFGGGCLPKDLNGFLARALECGADSAAALLHEVAQVNQRARTDVVDLAVEMVGGSVQGRRVAVLGAAFKPGTDDVRESPALRVAVELQALGADVMVHDPLALDNARRAQPSLRYAETVESACWGSDLTLHLTDWPEFQAIDPVDLGRLVRRRCLIDGRHTLSSERWSAAGWSYRAFGRPLAATALDAEREALVPELRTWSTA